MKKENLTEIKIDYTDDNGVTHIDGWRGNSEDGETLGYIFNKRIYYTDPENRYDLKMVQFVKELKADGTIIE